MSDWQPIETAPHGYDGTRFVYVLFLGWSKSGSFGGPVVVSGWMDGHRKPVHSYSSDAALQSAAPSQETV